MELIVTPSPSPDLVLSLYDPGTFPKFRVVFGTAFPFATRDPKEAEAALVLENKSSKDLTALRYRWVRIAHDGKERVRTVSSDSYSVDVYRAVLKPGDRKLITPTTTVDESFLDHVAGGGGGIGCGIVSRQSSEDVSSLRFEIDFLLLEDGEISGPDPDRYAAESQCRKRAAEYIAMQIRLAEKDGRDVTPVLNALAELPHLRGDHLVEWSQRYASDFLRHMNQQIGNIDMRDAKLRHLENRPALPKFYRRPVGS